MNAGNKRTSSPLFDCASELTTCPPSQTLYVMCADLGDGSGRELIYCSKYQRSTGAYYTFSMNRCVSIRMCARLHTLLSCPITLQYSAAAMTWHAPDTSAAADIWESFGPLITQATCSMTRTCVTRAPR